MWRLPFVGGPRETRICYNHIIRTTRGPKKWPLTFWKTAVFQVALDGCDRVPLLQLTIERGSMYEFLRFWSIHLGQL